MKKTFKKILHFAKRMVTEYGRDNTFELGAALAYYTIFSIVPLLVVVIAVSGIVAGPDAVRGQVFGQLTGLVGPDTAKALQDMLGEAYLSGKGVLATIIGLVTLFIGATGIFNSLKNSLNRMWGIEPKPKNSVVHFLVSRLLSFSFVMGLGFLLVVTFTLNALVRGFADKLGHYMPELGAQLVQVISFGITFVVSTLIFAFIFKFLPAVKIAWKDVLPGAAFTTVLFVLGELIIGLYFDSTEPASMFGAAAGLISLLIWTFYSSQTVFFGAEFVYVWCEVHGRPIQPATDAVKVVRRVVKMENGMPVEVEE
ncbi:MAG: YihY/virulence factor BrkB family protein [Flavobacteriales bacterium]|nr:YihY/virulence factor BrkB family protein [Flavobacteriales bacterium]